MNRYLQLSVDLVCVCLATVLALLLRDNLEPSLDRLYTILPYVALSLVSAVIVFPLAGTDRVIWRFGSLHDYLRVPAAVLFAVLGAVALGFALNRLEGVARALPFLQAIVLAGLMTGARVAHSLRHSRRAPRPMAFIVDEPRETVLILGINAITEALLRAAADAAPERIHIAGIVGRNERHNGRTFHKQAVLGTPELIASVLKELEAHGVLVDRIIITESFDRLSTLARRALADIEAGSDIVVDYFSERIGFAPADRGRALRPATSNARGAAGSGADAALSGLARSPVLTRRYWTMKRLLDGVAAMVLILLLAPLIAVVALLVLVDVGPPILFWQLRPGAFRRPFKLYKFRTMCVPHDREGRRISDAQRLSVLGRLLRRTRLDELPQLFHILTGEMSFVGPRPLLPVDQAPESSTRLSVRPGLTGWAQVNGGRDLSPADKAAMDIWYVHNASLRLDLIIAARTIRMLLSGDRPNAAAVHEAWQYLSAHDDAARRDSQDGVHRDGAAVAPTRERRVA